MNELFFFYLICKSDRQAEKINRVQREHISLRTKLAIFFNWGKIKCHSTGVESYFCHTFHLRPKKLGVGCGLCDYRVSSLYLLKLRA